MIIDSVNLDDLEGNAETAFVTFEERLRSVLKEQQDEDARIYRGDDGYYAGSHSPERYYVSSILAFLDEYGLDIDVEDISDLRDDAFLPRFNEFFNKINYVRTRFKLRRIRISGGQVGTPISIKSEFKDEIHQHLDVIRKIVNREVSDENKRDKIFDKIASLQNEIDRDRTTTDAVFSRLISLSKVLGDSAENVEPLVQKVERILTALFAGVTFVQLLPKRERPKLLPNPKRKPINDLDDDTPF